MSLEHLLVPFLFPIKPLQMFLGPPPVRSVWDATFDSSGCQVVHLSIDTVLTSWVGWLPDTFDVFSIFADLSFCGLMSMIGFFFLLHKICGISK